MGGIKEVNIRIGPLMAMFGGQQMNEKLEHSWLLPVRPLTRANAWTTGHVVLEDYPRSFHGKYMSNYTERDNMPTSQFNRNAING